MIGAFWYEKMLFEPNSQSNFFVLLSEMTKAGPWLDADATFNGAVSDVQQHIPLYSSDWLVQEVQEWMILFNQERESLHSII
jgi:hypothetical protein